MICGVCRRKNPDVSFTDYGILCETCRPGIEINEKALYSELLDEETFSAPDELDMDSFERYILKISCHLIAEAPATARAKLKKANPLLLRPRMLSLWIKGRVLEGIPLMYVSMLDYEGHEAVFNDGTYQFKKKVPYEVVMEALKKAGFAKREERQ